ncbi:hypothetical protein C5167_009996 [Papaver somniferum]|uniref:non-specific serine/threonine protein kinase n=1 Tax=Papaver somniferum TaxID=3469 RepID=A0A4Y7K1T3_PAPSO|nr:probable serine/threonine-protein kinase SIS8 [Papaver somniferum]RZC66312.1 hypothetical protein C5167_009996 [Papaver somniferum]
METPSPSRTVLVPGEDQMLQSNRIQEIEAVHDGRNLKQEFSQLTMNSSDKKYLNILQSMGQAIYVLDAIGLITYWNPSAENLYGYSASEALGRNILDLLFGSKEAREDAMHILRKNASGGSWNGTFPVKNKQGERILVLITNSPLYDDNGSIAGIICVSVDSEKFLQIPPASLAEVNSSFCQLTSREQPSQVVVTPSGACTLRGDVPPSPSGAPLETVSLKKFLASGEGEGKIGIHKSHTSTEEACTSKKNMPCPWKGSEHDGLVARTTHDIFAWIRSEQENDFDLSKSSDSFGFYSSSGKSDVSSVSSIGSTSLSSFDTGTDSSDYEIMWEELTVGEEIGRGACGTVYHGMWCGSDVALKVYYKFEYSEDLLQTFRQEVLLMKKLRHPNVLLFMGAVTSPENLCIVTEFLPRGSLFQLLQRGSCKLDKRRRVLMALDIARGMTYLHSRNPPVVHCDLKSSNLLVDKNWTVKVGDFGISRLKNATYLTGKSGRGTPQWMAPEVMRSDPSDEKSDVYSFGVILWELSTQRIPWGTLNSFQVIGAVGFMDQRLDIPKDTEPQWASLIESCWHSEPKCRPTFQSLLGQLKDLQVHYSVQMP